MIVTLSFVNGFEETVSGKVFSFMGHVRIQYRQPQKSSLAEEVPIEEDTAMVAAIKKMNNVRTVHPFATKNAILKTTDEIEGVLLKGLDTTYDFKILPSFLQPGGRWINYNDSTYSREIVISVYTAKQLQLKLNDRVLIYFIRPDGSLRPDKLTIVGL